MKMKRHIANILTSLRIVFAFVLLMFSGFSFTFLVIFSICGVTDLIDGPIARATGSQSVLGAKLDTTGDTMTYLAMVKALILEKVISVRTLLWFSVPLFGMLISAFIGKLKFHSFVFTHTALSKLFGVGCFFVPFSVAFHTVSRHLKVLWFVAFLAGVEMIAIQMFSNHANPDVFSLLSVRKSNEQFKKASAKNVIEG